MSGTLAVCIVVPPELLVSIDVSEPPPPQATSMTAMTADIAANAVYRAIVRGIVLAIVVVIASGIVLDIVRFMSCSPLHVP
jgi:hypothetical protein